MSAKVVVAVLRADETIGPMIDNTRVYPVSGVPDLASVPFIDYQVTSNVPEKDLAGNTVGIEAEINLEVVAETRAEVQTILDRLDVAFAALGGTTVAGVNVIAAQASETGDEISGPIDLDDRQAYIGSATIQIYYGA